MNDIDYLLANIKLSKTIEKMRSSVNEIIEKHPNRVSLINSMNESLNDLIEVKVMFTKLERHNMSLGTELFNYQSMSLDLKIENNELKDKNDMLKKQIVI